MRIDMHPTTILANTLFLWNCRLTFVAADYPAGPGSFNGSLCIMKVIQTAGQEQKSVDWVSDSCPSASIRI